MSKKDLREALEGLRERLTASFDKVIPDVETRVQIVGCILAVLAAYPVGVPAIPPSKLDCSQAIARAVLDEAEWWAVRWNNLEYGDETDAHIWELRHAIAIEQKSSTLCSKTPEGKEQE